jgi:hypothetical protein
VRIEPAGAAVFVFHGIVHHHGAVARADRPQRGHATFAAQRLLANQKALHTLFVAHQAWRVVAILRIHILGPQLERLQNMPIGIDAVVNAAHG